MVDKIAREKAFTENAQLRQTALENPWRTSTKQKSWNVTKESSTIPTISNESTPIFDASSLHRRWQRWIHSSPMDSRRIRWSCPAAFSKVLRAISWKRSEGGWRRLCWPVARQRWHRPQLLETGNCGSWSSSRRDHDTAPAAPEWPLSLRLVYVA